MSKYQVLCVDDEKNVLRSLTRLLRNPNLDLLTASSGDEALEIIKKNQIDLIISDYRMPKMSGTDLLKKVKAISPKTVRVMLTGFADSHIISDAIIKGEVGYFVPKPWDDNELKKCVHDCLKL